MKPETILNAYLLADRQGHSTMLLPSLRTRRVRQRDAFRSRILRMFAERDAEYAKLDKAFDNYIALKDADWLEMYQQLSEKDTRIAELEKQNEEIRTLISDVY